MYELKTWRLSRLLLTTALVVSSRAGADKIDEIREAVKSFDDLSATAVVTYQNKDELRKIDKGFAQTYEFKEASLWFKYPDKLKMSGKVGLVRVEYIMNGDVQIIRVPALHVSKRETFEKHEKRQTPLDVGVLSDAIWRDYDVSYEGEKQIDGNKTYVLFLEHKPTHGTQRLWIEVGTFKLLRREKYKYGKIEKRFDYQDSKRIDGVWVPGKLEAYSPAGKLAGVTEYRNIKVNTRIPDSQFD